MCCKDGKCKLHVANEEKDCEECEESCCDGKKEGCCKDKD